MKEIAIFRHIMQKAKKNKSTYNFGFKKQEKGTKQVYCSYCLHWERAFFHNADASTPCSNWNWARNKTKYEIIIKKSPSRDMTALAYN